MICCFCFFLDLENLVEKEDLIFKFFKVYLVLIVIFNLFFKLVLIDLDFDVMFNDIEVFFCDVNSIGGFSMRVKNSIIVRLVKFEV